MSEELPLQSLSNIFLEYEQLTKDGFNDSNPIGHSDGYRANVRRKNLLREELLRRLESITVLSEKFQTISYELDNERHKSELIKQYSDFPWQIMRLYSVNRDTEIQERHAEVTRLKVLLKEKQK